MNVNAPPVWRISKLAPKIGDGAAGSDDGASFTAIQMPVRFGRSWADNVVIRRTVAMTADRVMQLKREPPSPHPIRSQRAGDWKNATSGPRTGPSAGDPSRLTLRFRVARMTGTGAPFVEHGAAPERDVGVIRGARD